MSTAFSAYGEMEAQVNPPKIASIKVNRSNVFDLANSIYNRVPYTWANKIHIVTREEFIRRELLFKVGDGYDPDIMTESERNLRNRPIFRYVTISSTTRPDGDIDVLVKTDDVWTTSIQLAYGTAGGESSYRVGVLEHNFLGYGHTLGAFVRQDIDRFVKGVTYNDPHIRGSRWDGFMGYGEDEKGKDWEARLIKPYKAFYSRSSQGGTVRITQDEDRLFENGDETANFNHDMSAVSAFASVALDPNKETANRAGLAFESREDEFSDFEFKVPMAPPVDRTVKAVLITYEHAENRFQKIRGITTFDRDEDINEEWEFGLEVGPSLKSLGSTEDGLVHRERIQRNWIFPAGQILFVGGQFNARHENGRLVDSVARVDSQYAILDWWKENTVLLRGEVQFGIHLPVDKQFLLGGENGLRGYSVRQFSGAKKALFTLENRQALLYDWLNLINLGWAVFADTGGVWKENQRMSGKEFKSDVGVGLRFSPSRAFDPSLIRADIAYALNDNDRGHRWVVNIGGDLRFGDVEKRKFDQ